MSPQGSANRRKEWAHNYAPVFLFPPVVRTHTPSWVLPARDYLQDPHFIDKGHPRRIVERYSCDGWPIHRVK